MVLPVIKQTILTFFSDILNPEGHQNRCINLKVTAILLNAWILPTGGAKSPMKVWKILNVTFIKGLLHSDSGTETVVRGKECVRAHKYADYLSTVLSLLHLHN